MKIKGFFFNHGLETFIVKSLDFRGNYLRLNSCIFPCCYDVMMWIGKGQGRESKGRLITPYRSAAFLRDVINLIPKGPVSCHWSSHKEKNLRTFLHLLLLYTSCNSTNTFVFSSLHFTGWNHPLGIQPLDNL